MEFIHRSEEPEYLANNKEEWTKSWVDFYKKKKDIDGVLIRDRKPSDNHWTKAEIRELLISDFKNNCGYCGSSRPTPRRDNDKENAPRGHVDHYRAKAIYPELTYDWNNYIWSCESCNVEKGEFDNPHAPILNPCESDDCGQLLFIGDTGKYCLECGDSIYTTRFEHTDRKTMLNAEEIAVKRRNRVQSLKAWFRTTSLVIEVQMEPHAIEIISENVSCIKRDLEDKEFCFLMKKIHQKLRSEYPLVANLIDNF